MRHVRDIFAVVGAVLLVVSVTDRSFRALVAACIFAVAAYAIHRRFLAAWLAGCAVLGWSLVASARDIFRGPGTALAVKSSLLGVFVAGLLLSIWWRQRPYFHGDATSKA
jgi:uncharacterized membrane protein